MRTPTSGHHFKHKIVHIVIHILWYWVHCCLCLLWHVQIKELIAKCPEAISRSLLKACLSAKQWEAVMLINHALRQEYECRRQMLLQRLDVTILSFQWSDRAKVSADKIYLLKMSNNLLLSSMYLSSVPLPFIC